MVKTEISTCEGCGSEITKHVGKETKHKGSLIAFIGTTYTCPGDCLVLQERLKDVPSF